MKKEKKMKKGESVSVTLNTDSQNVGATNDLSKFNTDSK
jgi:hypothetical protein